MPTRTRCCHAAARLVYPAILAARHKSSICSYSSHVILQARDAFFNCVDELGSGFQAGQPVPSECKALRKKYEECCSASWVSLSIRINSLQVVFSELVQLT